MKNIKLILQVLFVCLVIISCTKDKAETELIGRYKLIEVLADPGDGSGTFKSVTSNKIIEFHRDGTVTSNEELCFMSTASSAPSSGTYSITNSSIYPSNCSDYHLTFERNGNKLVINYPCIEPCKVKFIKL